MKTSKPFLTCFKCRKLGHKATDCKEKQKMKTLIASKLDLQKRVLVLVNDQPNISPVQTISVTTNNH